MAMSSVYKQMRTGVITELHVQDTDHDDYNQGIDDVEVVVQLVDNPQRTRDRCSRSRLESTANNSRGSLD